MAIGPVDRFGNPIDAAVSYARGKILAREVDETLRQRHGHAVMREWFAKKGDAGLYNLTGLIRGFPFKEGDEEGLESHLHFHVRWERQLEDLALRILGGDAAIHDGFLATRVTAGILAIMVTMLKQGDRVLSLVAADRSHPSIRQAVTLAGGEFKETIGLEEFERTLKSEASPALVVITTISPSKHHLPAAKVLRAVELARTTGAMVMLDDAHMATRLAFYDEAPGLALGRPDFLVWSLDKHLTGPRSGFVAGRKEHIHKIRARAFALGLEAQPAQYVAGVRALEAFKTAPIREAGELARNLLPLLQSETGNRAYMAGPGVAIGGEDLLALALDRANDRRTELVPVEAASIASFAMLQAYGIVTIPVTGMPGAASVFRLMMYPDGHRLGVSRLLDAARHAISELVAVLDQPARARALLLGNA